VHDGLEQKEHDLNRDQVIQEFGIQILRFKNEEVMGDIGEVIRKIKGFLP
jgi:very-short-patch-repair endonuclease